MVYSRRLVPSSWLSLSVGSSIFFSQVPPLSPGFTVHKDPPLSLSLFRGNLDYYTSSIYWDCLHQSDLSSPPSNDFTKVLSYSPFTYSSPPSLIPVEEVLQNDILFPLCNPLSTFQILRFLFKKGCLQLLDDVRLVFKMRVPWVSTTPPHPLTGLW